MSTETEQPELRVGPDPNVNYPIQVQYCGNCSLPIEVNYIKNFIKRILFFSKIKSILCNAKQIFFYAHSVL